MQLFSTWFCEPNWRCNSTAIPLITVRVEDIVWLQSGRVFRRAKISYVSEMPLFWKFPEIRKFLTERKNFSKNETVFLVTRIIVLIFILLSCENPLGPIDNGYCFIQYLGWITLMLAKCLALVLTVTEPQEMFQFLSLPFLCVDHNGLMYMCRCIRIVFTSSRQHYECG